MCVYESVNHYLVIFATMFKTLIQLHPSSLYSWKSQLYVGGLRFIPRGFCNIIPVAFLDTTGQIYFSQSQFMRSKVTSTHEGK